MIKLIWRFLLLTAVAAGFAWLADRPGVVMLRWLGREIEMPLYVAVATLLLGLLALWVVLTALSRLFRAPGAVGEYFRFRRTRRGYESLSKGIIAAGAGDAALAAKHADIARRTLADEPLVRLLDAQSAQLRGDRAAVKRAFETMLASPDTEALGLRGLYAEARQAHDWSKAREYAERAIKISPTLAWASSGLLALQSAAHDWAAAEATLETQRRSGAMGAEAAGKLRAALLAARALDAEESDRDLAFDLALRAQKLDPTLVPAASVAAREHSRRGAVRRAIKVLRRTWEVINTVLVEVEGRRRFDDLPGPAQHLHRAAHRATPAVFARRHAGGGHQSGSSFCALRARSKARSRSLSSASSARAARNAARNLPAASAPIAPERRCVSSVASAAAQSRAADCRARRPDDAQASVGEILIARSAYSRALDQSCAWRASA